MRTAAAGALLLLLLPALAAGTRLPRDHRRTYADARRAVLQHVAKASAAAAASAGDVANPETDPKLPRNQPLAWFLEELPTNASQGESVAGGSRGLLHRSCAQQT